MTAFFLLMFVTPILSTIVTVVARPSGIAATARPTATINEFIITSALTVLVTNALTRLNANITTQMIRIPTVSTLES